MILEFGGEKLNKSQEQEIQDFAEDVSCRQYWYGSGRAVAAGTDHGKLEVYCRDG